jgi:hypothetical protein
MLDAHVVAALLTVVVLTRAYVLGKKLPGINYPTRPGSS